MKIFKPLFFFCIISIVSCNSEVEKAPTGSSLEENAFWIEDGIPLPESDSLFYLEHPAPLFRKEFVTDKEVESASLSITAAGYYKVSLNGNSIEENVLDPAWTDFNPLPLRKWGSRNLREDLKVGKPVFIAKLHIRYKNGSSKVIVSDNT